MNILPISFNKINNYKLSFKNHVSTTAPNYTQETTVPKQKIGAKKLLFKSKMILSRATRAQEIAQNKLKEAKMIQFNWQIDKPTVAQKNKTTKEYLLNWEGTLKTYIETNADGSKKVIKYSQGKVTEIIETDADGIENSYYFNNDKLTRFIQGKHTEEKAGTLSIITPNEFIFSANGNLKIYRENYKQISTFNRNQEFKGEFSTIETQMHFETDDDITYLKKAKTDIFSSPNGKRFYENEFEFDKDEN